VRTTFFLDLSINILELVSFILNTTLGNLAIVRIAKLGRVARVAGVVLRVQHRLESWIPVTLLGIAARLIAILFLLNHIICCCWFWIGDLQWTDTGQNWLDMQTSSRGMLYRNASPHFQYLTSLHWSFSQMTPGSMSVVPQNSLERCCNIACLFLGLFVSTLLISQLSAKMVRLQTLNRDSILQMEMLNRFLLEQHVPLSLATRIRRLVKERNNKKKSLTMVDLPSLSELPLKVLQELKCSIYARTWLSHTVFYTWCLIDETLIRELTFQATELHACSRRDDLFVPLQKAKRAYCVRTGSLRYKREIWTVVSGDAGLNQLVPIHSRPLKEDIILEPGAWASTVAIWCDWQYVGRLHALEVCDLVAFIVDSMLQVLEGYPQILKFSQGYATAYSLLATPNDSEFSCRADLDIPPARVLLAMSVQERSTFSEILMQSFTEGQPSRTIEQHLVARRNRLSHQATLQLRRELQLGKCIVTLGSDFQLLRTVVLCALKITNANEKVLFQVAEGNGEGGFVPHLVLPATKLTEGECMMAGAKRLMQNDLPPLIGSLECDSCNSEETCMKSKLGLRTVYKKTTYHMSLLPVEQPAVEARSSRSSRMSKERECPTTDIFKVLEGLSVERDDGRVEVYAWLTHGEFEYLQSPPATAEFQHWLSDYKLPSVDFL